MPHAGICAGGRGQPRSLPRTGGALPTLREEIGFDPGEHPFRRHLDRSLATCPCRPHLSSCSVAGANAPGLPSLAVLARTANGVGQSGALVGEDVDRVARYDTPGNRLERLKGKRAGQHRPLNSIRPAISTRSPVHFGSCVGQTPFRNGDHSGSGHAEGLPPLHTSFAPVSAAIDLYEQEPNAVQ